jgi:diguanylate cyclase (GGDEF)-like protein/PAS domain S-box-containing protein
MQVERQDQSRFPAPVPADVRGAGPEPHAVGMVPVLAAAVAGALGLSAVVGSLADVHGLLSWGAAPTIKLNMALAVIAAAWALVLLRRPSPLRRRLAHISCVLIGFVAALTLFEWVFGHSLGIDQLLLQDPTTAGVPGRASPQTALAVALFAVALLTLDVRSRGARRLHQLAGGAFLATVALAALGWLYGAPELTGHSRVTGMSLPTLTALAALLVGALFLRPWAPPFTLMRGGSPTATMMRRLVPAALVVPVVLGGLRLIGAEEGWYGVRFGVALFTTSMIVVFLGLVLSTARSVERGDEERRRSERAASAVQMRLQAILDHVPIGIYLRGLDERYELVNAHFAEQFGRPAEEIVGRTASELHPAELVEWARELERPIHERGESVSSESAAPHSDGTETYQWVLKYPVTDENGNLVAIGGAVLDITERRHAEVALAEAEAEQAALRRVATAVAVAEDVGSTAVFDLVAEEVARLLGVEVGVVVRFENDREGAVMGSWFADPATTIPPIIELDGTNATSLVARTGRSVQINQDERTTALVAGARAAVAAPISIGGRLWGTVGAAAMDAAELPPDAEERTARFADLAATAIENAEAREMLATLASTDELTGLANYRTFHERLGSEVERAQRHGRELSLIVIDIDIFKAINDEHGHPVGDAVLAEVAGRLAGQGRDSDLLARVGGEEFAWLLPETDAASAVAVAERARHTIADDPFELAGTVTISAGVCSLEDGAGAESLLRFADAALYSAKNGGRNATVRYTAEAVAAPARGRGAVSRVGSAA